jgi:hypothetical protein
VLVHKRNPEANLTAFTGQPKHGSGIISQGGKDTAILDLKALFRGDCRCYYIRQQRGQRVSGIVESYSISGGHYEEIIADRSGSGGRASGNRRYRESR